jgi:phosphatidylinositol alpha-1,6-mannosyltransferase
VRILYISHLHPPEDQPLKNIGGMQSVSLQLVKALQKKERIEIKTIIMHSSWKYIGLKTFLFLVSLLRKIPAQIKKYQPDVILFSSMVTASVLPFMINKPGIPCVTINHGQDVTLPNSAYQWYLSYVFNNLQGVISVSNATREACIERGMDPEIGISLPNGFESDKKENLPSKIAAKKMMESRFGINLENNSLLLTVGRLVKRKGHEWFISEVFHRISSPVYYLMIGDGPENEVVRQAKKKQSDSDKIIIAGRQPDEILNAAYAAADLFVMPNIPVKGDMEGFGIVLLEANHAGVPAVASDLEGIKDVIKDGVNGYRITHHQPEQFADKIDYILNNELTSLSVSAKKYVDETFSWNSVVDKYIEFLKTVSKKG